MFFIVFSTFSLKPPRCRHWMLAFAVYLLPSFLFSFTSLFIGVDGNPSFSYAFFSLLQSEGKSFLRLSSSDLMSSRPARNGNSFQPQKEEKDPSSRLQLKWLEKFLALTKSTHFPFFSFFTQRKCILSRAKKTALSHSLTDLNLLDWKMWKRKEKVSRRFVQTSDCGHFKIGVEGDFVIRNGMSLLLSNFVWKLH